MRFFETIFAGAALVAAALAVEINEFPSEVQAGRSYRITYTPGDDTPTTFILRKGENADLAIITTLTESATGGEFMWSVDSALPNADDYALEIRQGDENNFIGPISLSGGSDATSSAASSSGSASSTATDSSASSAATTETETETVTSVVTSASASITPSANGTTITTGTRTPSASPTESEDGGVPESTGAASAFGSSPMALIFGAVAAMAYLN